MSKSRKTIISIKINSYSLNCMLKRHAIAIRCQNFLIFSSRKKTKLSKYLPLRGPIYISIGMLAVALERIERIEKERPPYKATLSTPLYYLLCFISNNFHFFISLLLIYLFAVKYLVYFKYNIFINKIPDFVLK